MQCQFCGKECKNSRSLRQHEIRCKENPNRLDISGKNHPHFGKSGGNQHTKARREGRDYVVSEETRKKLSVANSGYGHLHTEEYKKRHSDIMKQVVLDNPESYSSSNVSGRVKTYEFNGLKFKGTWELIVAESLSELGVQYTNIVQPIEYVWNDSTHLYFPDFYLSEFGLYIEVKGYERERDRCKWKAVNNLIILKRNEIEDIKHLGSSRLLDILKDYKLGSAA